MCPSPAEVAASEFGVADLANTIAACDRSTWIVVELLEHDGTPMAGEPYEIRLPGGEVRTGVLDADGRAVMEGIDPGVAIVRFPERDAEDFGPLPHMPQVREGAPWIELELVDDAGIGVGGEPFELEFADGSRRSGTLDEHGRTRIEGIVEGECQVSFPDRDTDDLEPGPALTEPTSP